MLISRFPHELTQVSPSSLGMLHVLCMECWSAHGDVLANQYGGSGAMHKLKHKLAIEPAPSAATPAHLTNKGMSGGNGSHSAPAAKVFSLISGASNALVAVQRYYSNISTDFERQQCIDLLLGVYVPYKYLSPIHGTSNGHRLALTDANTDIGASHGSAKESTILLPNLQLWELEQHPSLIRESYRDVSREEEYIDKITTVRTAALTEEVTSSSAESNACTMDIPILAEYSKVYSFDEVMTHHKVREHHLCVECFIIPLTLISLVG